MLIASNNKSSWFRVESFSKLAPYVYLEEGGFGAWPAQQAGVRRGPVNLLYLVWTTDPPRVSLGAAFLNLIQTLSERILARTRNHEVGSALT